MKKVLKVIGFIFLILVLVIIVLTIKNVINRMANFVYHLVADGLISKHKEDEFNDEFEEFISGKKKNKDKDDSLIL